MVNKKDICGLQIIVPFSLKKRSDKLTHNTRTSSVSNQIVLLNDNSQQDSIIYTWTFTSKLQLEKLKSQLTEQFSKDYFPIYHISTF